MSRLPDDAADATLVARIRGGADRAAERELCRRFLPRARLYGLRHLGTEEAAADLSQDALVVVLEAARAGRIEDPERLASFVLGTCRNLAHAMRRRAGRAADAVAADPDLAEALVHEPEVYLLDLPALQRCMGGLSPQDVAVLAATFLHDRDAATVGATLSIAPGNVRVIRHRALVRLRQCMDSAPAGGTT